MLTAFYWPSWSTHPRSRCTNPWAGGTILEWRAHHIHFTSGHGTRWWRKQSLGVRWRAPVTDFARLPWWCDIWSSDYGAMRVMSITISSGRRKQVISWNSCVGEKYNDNYPLEITAWKFCLTPESISGQSYRIGPILMHNAFCTLYDHK